jgi:hypothetical protein
MLAGGISREVFHLNSQPPDDCQYAIDLHPPATARAAEGCSTNADLFRHIAPGHSAQAPLFVKSEIQGRRVEAFH